MRDSLLSDDTVERPALGWWLSILGGLGLLALLAAVPEAYEWWATHVTTAISQTQMLNILLVAILLHAGEAFAARRRALRSGLTASANAWALQTFLIGFPSLRLLRQRTPA